MSNNQSYYPKIDFKEIGERVRLIRGQKSQSEFAKEFGMLQADISRIERGEIKHIPEVLHEICVRYNKNFDWLLTGGGPEERGEEAGLRVCEVSEPYEDFVFVPQVAGKIGAGEGLLPDTYVEMRIAFRRDWIIRKGDPEKMSLVRVKGDSMEPTLFDGDLVLIDHNRDYVEPPGGIYAVFMNEVIIVKRIQVLHPPGKLRIISDNPKYESMDVYPDQIKINGKVIWFARELER